jgi:hypothetical protein
VNISSTYSYLKNPVTGAFPEEEKPIVGCSFSSIVFCGDEASNLCKMNKICFVLGTWYWNFLSEKIDLILLEVNIFTDWLIPGALTVLQCNINKSYDIVSFCSKEPFPPEYMGTSWTRTDIRGPFYIGVYCTNSGTGIHHLSVFNVLQEGLDLFY